MIILGIILVLASVFLPLGPVDTFVYWVGWLLVVVGVLFLILGLAGHPVGGRRYWL